MLVMLATMPVAAQTSLDRESASRVALVIGNSAYQSVETLPNPANDARLIAEKLWESGFEVIESIEDIETNWRTGRHSTS